MAKNNDNLEKGLGLHARRAIAYIVLIIISFFCLFQFFNKYLLGASVKPAFNSPFILMIMMIPTQVTALGFIKLVTKMGLMDSFIPLIVPAIASISERGSVLSMYCFI